MTPTRKPGSVEVYAANPAYMTAAVVADPDAEQEVLLGVRIVRALAERGVLVFWEPDYFGMKLYRAAAEAASRDRMIVIASPTSLMSNHVQNQVDRVLEREHREGAGERLIPITCGFNIANWCAAEGITEKNPVHSLGGRISLAAPAQSDTRGFDKLVKRLLDALTIQVP